MYYWTDSVLSSKTVQVAFEVVLIKINIYKNAIRLIIFQLYLDISIREYYFWSVVLRLLIV